MRILITDGMDKAAMAQLRELGHEVVEQFYEPDQLGAALRDFDAVVVRSKTKVRANHIDEAKGGKLKLDHPWRRGCGQHRRQVRRGERHHRPQHPRCLLPVCGGAGHGPYVRLHPLYLHRRSYHA